MTTLFVNQAEHDRITAATDGVRVRLAGAILAVQVVVSEAVPDGGMVVVGSDGSTAIVDVETGDVSAMRMERPKLEPALDLDAGELRLTMRCWVL